MIKTLFNKFIEQLYFKQRGNLALYDRLTEVYNYNWLQVVGAKKYYNKEVYVTVFDVNGFKQINDSEGHVRGNMVLQDIARQLTQLKGFDPTLDVIRYGGDEFVMISSIDLTSIVELVNEKEKRVSFGTVQKKPGEHIQVAFANADNLMYQYKMDLKARQKNSDKFKVLHNNNTELRNFS